MKNFQLVNREYVPSVDLNVLGDTFNTLQQGHKETVQKASELKTYIAGLDMNEAEDDFKRQLLNEIETTIDDNTIYGNSYGALDDIITKAGDITSDDRIINRLKSQKAYKDYQAKVDKMNIPEGMKQMYKEENPYHYEDGPINEKTGKPIGGKIWKENTTPVTTIPEYEIQKYVLQIAAKEAGGGDSVTFLDKYGKPTPDPTKSFDGSIYKQVGTKFERLSEDKIKKAYNIAINSIPGAKDSLHQDYKYATWQYDKAVEKARQEGGDITPYVPGYTDKNGNVYSEEQWLNNKINGFADVAAYNHVYSNTSYGTALQNYRAAEAKSRRNNENDNYDNGFGVFTLGTQIEDNNSFGSVQNSLNDANNQGMRIINKYFPNGISINGQIKKFDNITELANYIIRNDKNKTRDGKNKYTGPGSVVNGIIKVAPNMSNEDKVKLRNSFMGVYYNGIEKNKLLQKAGADKDALLFSGNISNQEYTIDNKYGREINSEMNDIFKYNKTIPIDIGSDVMNQILKEYGVYNVNDLIKQGFNIKKNMNGGYDVTFTPNERNLLPRFASVLEKANSYVTGSVWGYLKSNFTGKSYSGNYKVNIKPYYSSSRSPHSTFDLNTLAIMYNSFKNTAEKVEAKVGVSKGVRTVHGFDADSYGELFYRENALDLNLSENELQNKIERQRIQVDNMFANANFDSGSIEELDAAGNISKNIKNAQDAKLLIQKMYRNSNWKKNVARNVVVPRGGNIGQPKGYQVSFTVPEGADTGVYKAGDVVNFIVSSTTEEEIDYNPSYNITMLANNSIQISKTTNGVIDNLGYDNNLGDTRLIPNKNGYKTFFMGNNIDLNDEEAEKLITYFIALDRLKVGYINGDYTDSNEHIEQFQNNVGNLINNISTIVDLPINDVGDCVVNYLKDINSYE